MSGTDFPRTTWQMGAVIPRLLLVVCLVDVSLRFMSIDPLTFRAWEALTRYRPLGAAFEPNRHYSNERSYGDSAAMGNHPELRQYRHETFTTDALGFRNVAASRSEPAAAILIGDSFAVGSGVSDEETLSSRLSTLSGCIIYNAGSEHAYPDPAQVLALARNLHMQGGLILHLYSEDRELPAVPTQWQREVKQVLVRTPEWAGSFVGRVRGLITVSPLRIMSERAMKAIANDRIFPNRYDANVVKATLSTGDSMLFLASRLQNFYSKRREASVEYWTWMGAELRRERLNFLVLLVPGKYTVYRRFLVNQGPVGYMAGDYLYRLEHALRAAGVPVLHLAPIFLARAGDSVARGEFLYWLDDVHWTSRGIDLAAATIQESWPLTGPSCGGAHRSLTAKTP